VDDFEVGSGADLDRDVDREAPTTDLRTAQIKGFGALQAQLRL
jgi:hypothetical protein